MSILMPFVMVGFLALLSGGQAQGEEFTAETLNSLAATHGRPADFCGEKRDSVFQNRNPFNTSLILEQENLAGVKEKHVVARGKIPAGTRVGRNPKTGELYYTCIGGFRMEGPQFITDPKRIPKLNAPTTPVPPIVSGSKEPQVILHKVEIAGEIKHSHSFEMGPGLQAFLENKERIEGEFRDRDSFVLGTRRRPCGGGGTIGSVLGGSLAGYGAGSLNSDAERRDRVLSISSLVAGLAIAGVSTYVYNDDPLCELGGFVAGAVGGAVVGSYNRPDDARRSERQPPPLPPPPSPPGPGGIPPPDPNAPPFPPADPPN